MSHYQESLHRSSHLIAATVVSFWLTTSQLVAQTQETAFGVYRSLATPGHFEHFLLRHGQGALKTLFLWNHGEKRIATLTIDTTLGVHSWKEHAVEVPLDDFLIAGLAKDRQDVGVLVSKAEKRLAFVTDLQPDTLRIAGTLTLPVTPTGIAIGDVNNDQRLDLLVYDHDNPGVIPFFGVGGLRFRQGSVIGPDNAVSQLALVHLNNDNLMDFVFYDWVRSELHLVYGVGQGKFLDQSAYPVEGEVNQLLAAQMTPTGILDFVLSYEKSSVVEVWEGNGLGDFRPRMRIPLNEPATSIVVSDVNRDGFKDIVALERASQMQVFLSAGMESPPDHNDFSAGGDTRQVLLEDVDGDSLPDALLLDRERQQILIYRNAQASITLDDSLEFVTGLGPLAVRIDDTNGDNFNDVALVNAGSNSLSMFSNVDGRGIQGQITYSLAAGPRNLAFHSLWDSTARFVISYPKSDQLSFLTIDSRDRSFTNAIMPVAGATEILASAGSHRDLVDFFCFTWVSSSGTPSLTLFQQIGGQTFIERSFRLSIPNALLGAAVGDLNGDAMLDVAYIYRNNSTSKYEFAISLGDSASSFKQKTFSYELSETVIERSYLWIADVTRDSIPDVAFSFPMNDQILRLARGDGHGSFARPDTIAVNIRIGDREQLQLVDFDGDGMFDILVFDANSRSVGWLRGRPGAAFDEFRALVSDAGIGRFAVGDVNGDGVPDLAVTLTDKGTMKLYDGKMLRRGQGEKFR